MPVEYIDAPSRDFFECLCGNNPAAGRGFPLCDKNGVEIPEGADWDGKHIVCPECGRIIDQTTYDPTTSKARVVRGPTSECPGCGGLVTPTVCPNCDADESRLVLADQDADEHQLRCTDCETVFDGQCDCVIIFGFLPWLLTDDTTRETGVAQGEPGEGLSAQISQPDDGTAKSAVKAVLNSAPALDEPLRLSSAPDDVRHDNTVRACRAGYALNAYIGAVHDDAGEPIAGEPLVSVLGELLAGIRHLCDAFEVEFSSVSEFSERRHDDQVAGRI